jgi:hypothetical protein
MNVWQGPIDISVKISTASCLRKFTEMMFTTPPSAPNYMVMVDVIKLSW